MRLRWWIKIEKITKITSKMNTDLDYLDIKITGYGLSSKTIIKGVPEEFGIENLIHFLKSYFGTHVMSETNLITLHGRIENKYIKIAIREYLRTIPSIE